MTVRASKGNQWFLAVLGGLLMTLVASRAGATIEMGPIPGPGGQTYYLLSPTTWNDANGQAVFDLGGHLVAINDLFENIWVDIIREGPAGGGSVWIGLHYDLGLATYAWTSGEPVTYVSWAPGEPQATGIPGYYVAMEAGGQWANRSELFSAPRRAIVEVPPGAFPGCSLEGTWTGAGSGTWSLDESGGTVSGIEYAGSPIVVSPVGGSRAGATVTLNLCKPPYCNTATLTPAISLSATMIECNRLSLTATTPPFTGLVLQLTRTRPSYCGDGNVDPGESCDDGDFDNDPQCLVTCGPPSLAGNGIVDPGEDCDDGNPCNKDACLNSCEDNVCGDGFVNVGVEVCDDGNTTPGDGCAANCTLEVETASGDLSTGEIKTGYWGTPSDPIETAVWSSGASGQVDITEQSAPPNVAPGFLLAGTQVQVAGPNVMASSIQIAFFLNSSVIPCGQDGSTLNITKDGLPVGKCPSSGACASFRNEGLTFIQTPSLSDWAFSTSVCGDAPVFGCQPALPGSAKLKLKERGQEDQLKWKWKSSRLTPASILGDPTAANDYTLCLYDASGRRLQVTAPAGTSCAGEPCWKQTGTGFKYKDTAGSAAGITKLGLKSGDVDKGTFLLKARGPGLDLPNLPLTLPVMAQLRSRDGACWEASFSSFRTSDAEGFSATSD